MYRIIKLCFLFVSATRLRGKAIAPDVKNEELFPSLSAAKAIDPVKK